jgi:molecular chaperone DnaK
MHFNSKGHLHNMRVKAGLDFGTTTSTLSFMEDGRLTAFRYGGDAGRGTQYVPTAVAYFTNDIQIGQFALDFAEDATLHRFFKLALPRDPSPADKHTAEELTADFIGELIKGISPGRGNLSDQPINDLSFQEFVHHEIESLVVSVPHIWEREAVRGRQRLEKVVRQVLELDSIKLISEPVAAAAYFSYSYKQANNKDYRGNLLVCDMGGGTFDVTLCRLKPNHVEVIQNDGSGGDGHGAAGMFFDRTLINLFFGDNIDERELVELLVKLDGQKQTPRRETILKVSLKSKNASLPIYTLDHAGAKHHIRLDLIEQAFVPIRQEIFSVLQRLQTAAGELKEQIDRIVLVGGFSMFPLVQQAICEFFGEDLFGERRRVDLESFGLANIAFAISYGACLVANGVVTVSEKYPHTIGVMVTDAYGHDLALPLVIAGHDRDQLLSPQFGSLNEREMLTFKLSRPSMEVEVFIRTAGNLESDTIVRPVKIEVPHFSHTNAWTLGARVDYSKEPFLTIKDQEFNETREISMARLFPELLENLE